MIRHATRDDIPALVDMGLRFIRESGYDGRIAENPAQIGRFLSDLIGSDVGVVFVSTTEAGAVTGTIVLLRYVQPFSGQVIVSELAWWVNPEHRGHGLRLLKHAEQWAAESGAELMQMIAPTAAVESLYQRLGYERLEAAYQRRMH